MPRYIAGFAAAGFALSVCFAWSPALAGDSNSLSILQSGSNNSLMTDQSNAFGSQLGVGTNPFGSSGPLAQRGDNNSASITVSGGQASGGLSDAIGSAFLQQGTLAQPGSGNTASISIVGAASVGSVTQNGNGNDANLTVEDGAHGAINQTGNGNQVGLKVSGNPLSVTYNQQGNNLTTGPGGITITSTAVPGLLPAGANMAGTLPAITITQK
jgi:hypothetical protein